ncbi:MAG: dipeptidase [Chlorobi bacterium]|nr:dipeptidase [Chlorobiota bacterium]MCI0716213.1 dipeptidase [Chlorobiota bacterium]
MKQLVIYTISLVLFQNFACFSSNSTDKKVTEQNTQITDKKSNEMDSTTLMDSTTAKFSNLNKDAFKLHYDAIVVDTHNDILMPIYLQGADIGKNNPHTQSDFVKWKKGGLDVQVFSIYVPERYKTNHFSYVMKLIDKMEEYSAEYSETFQLARNYEELMNGLNSGKFCGLMGAEGGGMVEGKMENLETLYNRGVRYLGLTWNTSNEIATSARDESLRGGLGGLTEFGKQVVAGMNKLGMLIDVSHLGETAFWNVVELSKGPIIASHSCVYNLAPHYRNLTDEQIKAIAKSGGYIGVNFFCKFLQTNAGNTSAIQNKYKSEVKKIETEFGDDLVSFNEKKYEYLTENKSTGGTPIDVLIDHIDYIVKLVGVDYVGLGSDFDGSIYTPNELYDATCYPIITKKLVERGYTEEDIRKILGLNFLRVFKQVCNK